MLSDTMLDCLRSLDVARARRVWHEGFPNMPPISTDGEMLITLHMARTQSLALENRLRFYSHCWLTERNLQSFLPDDLKPAAERMFPRVVSAVGISINSSSSIVAPAVPIIRSAMENAVLEAYGDGRGSDIPFVKKRMDDAKKTATQKLFGKIANG